MGRGWSLITVPFCFLLDSFQGLDLCKVLAPLWEREIMINSFQMKADIVTLSIRDGLVPGFSSDSRMCGCSSHLQLSSCIHSPTSLDFLHESGWIHRWGTSRPDPTFFHFLSIHQLVPIWHVADALIPFSPWETFKTEMLSDEPIQLPEPASSCSFPTYWSFYLKDLFPFLSLTQFMLLLQITASWTSSCPWDEGWRPLLGLPNALCPRSSTHHSDHNCLFNCLPALLNCNLCDSRKWMHLVSLLIDHQHLISTQKCSLHVDTGSGWMDEWLYRWMLDVNWIDSCMLVDMWIDG